MADLQVKTFESLVAELTENLKRATIEEKRECLNEVDLDRASIEAIWEIFQQPRRVVDHHDASELDLDDAFPPKQDLDDAFPLDLGPDEFGEMCQEMIERESFAAFAAWATQ